MCVHFGPTSSLRNYISDTTTYTQHTCVYLYTYYAYTYNISLYVEYKEYMDGRKETYTCESWPFLCYHATTARKNGNATSFVHIVHSYTTIILYKKNRS